ncbi:MAG TPA: MarR family transcriptional regulator [Herpetosiphonaceae bacterium]
MMTTQGNARQLLQLFEIMRQGRPGLAFQRLNRLNLSFSHVRALHLLVPDKTLAMKDLAEQLQMTPPSVTALTRRLVQTGLVQRGTHPEDSRVVLVSLTDEGRSLFNQLYEDQLRRMERLLQGLTPAEQQLFLSLLERAIHAMRDEQPEPTETASSPEAVTTSQ